MSAGHAKTTTVIQNAALPGREGLWRVTLTGDRIASVEPAFDAAAPLPRAFAVGHQSCVDAAGQLLVPGFVDCHTHACWHDPDGTHRLDEWDLKRAGRGYLEVLAAGGGIMATVRAVRAATEEQLADQLRGRIARMARNGSTTIEVKSGYGLTTRDELKMLRVISRVASETGRTLVPTALLGHAIDPDVPRERFIRAVIDETLPAVGAEFGPIAIDAFCEQGAWTLDECRELFEAATKRGHPIRVHADQFTSAGMTPLAVRLGARSVDHLEASTPADLAALAAASGTSGERGTTGAGTFAVGLPACGHHLDGRFANLGELVRLGSHAAQPGPGNIASRICIASNLNPGSAPCWSMAAVISLAVRRCGLSSDQALAAATANPARLLGLHDRGEIAPGRRADLVLTAARSARELAFGFGDAAVVAVWMGGDRFA